jgi:ferric-dicitrate binding protein FerR (iron transport regulator)
VTEPKSLQVPSATFARLTREGGRVRALAPEEREALWQAIERRAPASRKVAWQLVAAFVAVSFVAAVIAASSFTSGGGRVKAAAQPERVAPSSGMVAAAAPPALAAAKPEGARTVSLQGRGELVLAPRTVATLPPALATFAHGAVRIGLESGRVDATVAPRAPDEPFAIVTPQLTVVVVGTRFSVVVDSGVSTVSVEHGRVRVEKDGMSVLVGSGESIRSDDAAFEHRSTEAAVDREHQASAELSTAPHVAAPVRSVPAPESCVASAPAEKRACLSRAASARGLGGENALLSLALLERDILGDRAAALTHFREYERRYPNGALAPEVALALVATLSAGGAVDAACAATADYARRHPADRATIGRLEKLCASK